MDSFEDLKEGELLVHRDYGIGRFRGLKRIDMAGTGNDFLVMEYQGSDSLYVPVDRLSLIQRFKGGDGAEPALDKLGGARGNASKERARKAIEKAGLTPEEVPVRGGTDGAMLSWKGLPCPNLGTGGFNFHGVCECITAERMDRCTEILLNIIGLYAE